MENLDLVSKHKNYQEKEYEKWRFRFEISLSLTWILPLLLLGAQFAFVGNQIDYDVLKLSNWVGMEAAFALPIRLFVLMVTITTLLGLYARSLQFSEQLRLSKMQQNLAFEQLKIAQKQSDRLESQLSLYMKKESFLLYHEHIQRFKDKLDNLLALSKKMFRYNSKVEGESLLIFSERLYKHVFPENNHLEIQNANLKSSNVIFNKDNPIVSFDRLSQLDTSAKGVVLEEQLRIVTENFMFIGIHIKLHSNSGTDFDIALFAIDLQRALFLINMLGLMSDEHFDEVFSKSLPYFKPFFVESENDDSNLQTSQS